MNKSFATRTDNTRDDWQTPEHIVKALGTFDLDPCANVRNPSRLAGFGYDAFGLELPWFGRVWCNPPYGAECRVWINRLAAHGEGIALIPPRVGSRWFQNEVFDKADSVLFLKGRIAFLDDNLKPLSGNNADSILIAFGNRNTDALSLCGLPGKLWRLR